MIAGWLVNTMESGNRKKLQKVRVIDFSKGYQEANSLLTHQAVCQFFAFKKQGYYQHNKLEQEYDMLEMHFLILSSRLFT